MKKVKLRQQFVTTSELFLLGDAVLDRWLRTAAGGWCKKHTVDLTFRINYQYNDRENQYPIVEIMARLTPEEYTLYLLKYGGTDETTNDRHP